MMYKKGILIFALAMGYLGMSPALFGQETDPEPASEICPILNGAQVPDGILMTQEGKEFNFRKETKKQPVILIFYRGGWCPYCNKDFKEINEIEEELIELGYRIIAVSPDRPSELAETQEKIKMGYTLLSDSKMEFIDSFGLGFRVNDATVKKYKIWKIDLEAASGETHHRLPVPAAYVINAKGEITFSYLNPDYKTRVSKEVLLSAAKAAL